MDLCVQQDAAGVDRAAAAAIAGTLAAKPDAAIVLATGNTPMGAYRELAAMRARGEVDASRLRAFQLDAYIGVGPEDPRSLFGWLDRAFLQPMETPAGSVVRLRGDAPDPEAACRAFDDAVAEAGGFDLAVLGLGPNGHVGFNEPPSPAASSARIVDLTEASIVSNARYWGARDLVPGRALTAGMASLIASRHVLLLVTGAHKRDILRRTLTGPITPDVPASQLRMAARLTVLADRDAWPEPAAP